MPKPPRGMSRQKNRKSWAWRKMVGGVSRYESLGTDYSEAVRKALQLNREVDGGKAPPARITVRDAADKWLELYIPIRRNKEGQKLAAARVERYLKEFFKFTLLPRVESNALRAYRVWLERQGVSLRTVSHILSDARCFFYWCADSGYIERSPMPRKLLPGIQESPPDRLTDGEVETLLSKLQGPLLWTVRFGLATGMRWGEMARAQVSDVDFGLRMITVHHTKSGKVRRVPLPRDIIAELRNRRNRVEKIIPYSVCRSGSINRDIRRRTGIEQFHLHQLRHTYSCRFIEREGSLAALQQILGHASVETTQRYARLSDEAVRREAEKVHFVAGHVAAQVNGPVSYCAPVAQVDRATVF